MPINYKVIKEVAELHNQLPSLLYKVMEKDAEEGLRILKMWGERKAPLTDLHEMANKVLEKEEQFI